MSREVDESLAIAMTGNQETRDWVVVIESIEAIADDLDVLWQATTADDGPVDLTGFVHRLGQRARLAATLANHALHVEEGRTA
ncbi:MAG TPA: hypothetical protein VK550_36050 [Polyangiaceae bacterium]|nr:hypothetical protein [Polyangiaceae bacterium]